MTSRVVILEQLDGPRSYRYLMWADVPAARQAFYANPDATSAYRGIAAGDLQDLKDGKAVERVEIGSWPGMTLAQVQTQLEVRWTAFQVEVTNEDDWTRYGTRWTSGGTWINAGA